jgi:hypothetical protein
MERGELDALGVTGPSGRRTRPNRSDTDGPAVRREASALEPGAPHALVAGRKTEDAETALGQGVGACVTPAP